MFFLKGSPRIRKSSENDVRNMKDTEKNGLEEKEGWEVEKLEKVKKVLLGNRKC